MPMSPYVRHVRSKIGNEFLLMPSVTGLVFDAERRLLLVRPSHHDVWVAPGGAVDPDEAPQDALVREVWEETGLVVEPTQLLGVFGGPEFRVSYASGDEMGYVMALYECRVASGRLRADGDEIEEARYFSPNELASIALSRWAEILLPRFIAQQRPWLPSIGWQPPSEP